MRGDLHMHTTESDGRATLAEMAEAARERGLDYIAITDHSKSLAMTNGLDEKRAVAFAHQVREMNQQELGLRVFSGLECDIMRDGAMDLADDALAELDWVVGSVHSYMNLEPAEMTDRLLRALECPSPARDRASHGSHSAASRSVPVRLRSGGGGGGAAQCVPGNQCESGAAGSFGDADPHGQGQGLQVRDLDRCASSEAPGQHELRRAHGAAGVAGGGRHSEHAIGRGVCGGNSPRSNNL